MATATIPQTAKGALKCAKGKVHSVFFDHQGSKSLPISVIQAEKAQFEKQAETARFTLENLLPVEETQRSRLERRVRDIERLLSATKPRLHKYPVFSTEPLTWRDKKGYPRLILMALDQDGFVEISAERRYSEEFTWKYLPLSKKDANYEEISSGIITRCYYDVAKTLAITGPNNGSNSIQMRLGQLLIPPKTRQKIADARHFFGDQLFLIAEADKWEENKVVYPDPDPLVVGYQDGLLFLIDAFDLTPIEQMAAVEFTVPPENLGL